MKVFKGLYIEGKYKACKILAQVGTVSNTNTEGILKNKNK